MLLVILGVSVFLYQGQMEAPELIIMNSPLMISKYSLEGSGLPRNTPPQNTSPRNAPPIGPLIITINL